MTLWRLIARSLAFHGRIQVAVALGVAAATAVLTGALLVGDSVRGSLRDLSLDRLGRIDQVLVADRFFRAQLADELRATPEFDAERDALASLALFPDASAKPQGGESQTLAAQVMVLGVDSRFWELGDASPRRTPEYDEVVINQPLADELGVREGDELVLRLPKPGEIPADSALAHKTERIRSLAGLRIIEIIPAEGLGRFSLRPNQVEPQLAFVALAQLQDALEQPAKVNALLLGASRGGAGAPADRRPTLAESLRPQFADFGFTLERATRVHETAGEPRSPYDYLSVGQQRMMFDAPMDELVAESLRPLGGRPVLTYLANTIAKLGEDSATGIPYSTITGIDFAPEWRLTDVDGQPLRPLADDELALNQWAAEQLDARVGDRVRVSFFAPETTHGRAEEMDMTLQVAAIVPLTEPVEPYEDETPPRFDRPPTFFNDPFLTPTVEGITDEDSIANWDPPFPYDSTRIKPRDDTYWKNQRTTPKAFVSLSTARKYWGSRFGGTTSYRVPLRAAAEQESADLGLVDAARVAEREQEVRAAIERGALAAPGRLGFEWLPVRQQALDASSGTTPFDALFLGLSLFIVVAALILVSLLFQLGVEQRAAEAGTMLAVGMPRKRVRAAWTREGLIVAAIGAGPGLLLGVAYAWLMIAGLRTWWVGAITTPFLDLHVTAKSLALGYLLGVLVCVLTISWRLRALRRLSIRRLLAGEPWEEPGVLAAQAAARRAGGWAGVQRIVLHPVWAGGALVVAAVALGVVAARLPGGEAQAGAFVGSGALILTGALLMIRGQLNSPRASTVVKSLGALSRRNMRRQPTRSTLVVGLMAVATFLIVAMSAFRLAPTREGSGGFDLVAESAAPIFADLNSAAGREEVLPDSTLLDGSQVLALRLRPGDDASCRNLYQTARPRVLGVSRAFVSHFDAGDAVRFPFAAAAPSDDEATAELFRLNPWHLIERDRGAEAAVPVILDKNTAMYSMHLYGGLGQKFTVDYEDGRQIEFEVVGLLANSVLQGSLLIGERAFERLFPDIGGYRMFLVGTPSGRAEEVSRGLEEALSDQGLDCRSAERLLRDLLAVQNTYLSTFQSLGMLGLLLGTFGLATVQLRSVFERRKELALMRAEGCSRRRLAGMVLGENVLLLATGLATGAIAALLAVLPYRAASGAQPPWADLVWMLGLVLLTGVVTGLLAARATLRAPLIPALRGE